MPDQPTDAAQIQALLHELSRVRLAVSADLSGAAGALDDNRPDVASDMVAGARRELAELLDPAREKYHPKALVSALGALDDESPMEAPERNGRSPRHRLGRALAGAAALAVAIAVVPQVTGGSSHRSTGATAAAPSPSMELASSQFAMLSERLAAADASPAAILAAGRSWQAAISRNLPAVAGQAEVASTAVTMLRLERTLLQVSPTLRAPQNRTVAVTLAAASDRLLRQLRSLADPQVLAILPAAIQALPLSPSKPTVPVTGATPAPTTAPAVASGTSAQPPGGPQAAPTNPAAPQAPTQPTSAPSLGSGLPVPQLPLPSALGQLTGGGTQGDGLSQTVGQVLSGLGLGG